MNLRNLLKSKFSADLNIVFFYLSRRVTFQAALLKTLSFFLPTSFTEPEESFKNIVKMDEIFPSLSWMIYFPCEGHFARQCLCSTFESSKRINTLILMVRHRYLIKVYSSLRNYISHGSYLWKYFRYVQEK